MRVLHTLASPYWSGPAENVAHLALAQRLLGHDVSVAVDARRTETTSEELAAPRFAALGLLDDRGLSLCVKDSPLASWRDIKRLSEQRLDVVHAHFSHDHFIARWGRPRGAALVRSIHAPRSLRRLMPTADAWTVPYEKLARAHPHRRSIVLPPFVDHSFTPPLDREALRKELGLEDGLVCGMVSTFQPSRRHLLGVDAFELVVRANPRARLLLIGDGELMPEVKSRVEALQLQKRVQFPGYQSGASFVRWLQTLDVVWILGLGNDWSARAAAQARACGVRVIAVDEGALPAWADGIVEPRPDAIASETLGGARRDVPLPTASDIARRVLDLYERAR